MKNVKTIVMALFIGAFVGHVESANAQVVSTKEQKEIIKNRKELAKQTRKQVEANVWKDAKKVAKQLKKDGWKPFPGSPTLETQQSDMMMRRYELEGNFPRYVLGEGTASAKSSGVARKQAQARARVELASNIGAEVAALTEGSESNNEYSSAEQETVAKMLESNKILVQQSIGRTEVVFEAYREKAGSTEVLVWICCDGSAAKSAIYKAFNEEQKELREKSEKTLEKK